MLQTFFTEVFGQKTSEPIDFHKDVMINQLKLMFSKTVSSELGMAQTSKHSNKDRQKESLNLYILQCNDIQTVMVFFSFACF